MISAKKTFLMIEIVKALSLHINSIDTFYQPGYRLNLEAFDTNLIKNEYVGREMIINSIIIQQLGDNYVSAYAIDDDSNMGFYYIRLWE
jgi:hypothetical protein